MKNFWLIKRKEKLMIRVVQWAQRNKMKVELLTKQDILNALKEDK
jgi:DNA repair photolyase